MAVLKSMDSEGETKLMSKYISPITSESLTNLCTEIQINDKIDTKDYSRFGVKRGLRNADGTGVMAGLTADSWVRAGSPCNWRTILYGSVGTLLYVGNICGSVASVRVYYKQFDEQRTEAVVCSLHIPLRTIFK